MNTMLRMISLHRLLAAGALAAVLGAAVAIVAAENIDPNNDNSQFAYGENIGWINFEPAPGPGVTITGSGAYGYAYGENVGWINFNCSNNNTCATTGNYGVTNDGKGKLGGYAWGENIGWISFACFNNISTCATTGNYGVTVNQSTGVLSGRAWAENVGWITFSDDAPFAYKVQASTTADTDGDGDPDLFDNCSLIANGTQLNTDAAPLATSGTPVVPNDNSIANSDAHGNDCDTDDDNDGIPDANEAAGCNGSGALNVLAQDTDGDRIVDGAECVLGSNPASNASRPVTTPDADNDRLSDAQEAVIGSNPNVPDTDGDGILDGPEYRGYNTSPTDVTSDLDSCPDDAEIASVDANVNLVVNAADLAAVAFRFLRTDSPVQDIDKNGTVNSADLGIVAQNFLPTPC